MGVVVDCLSLSREVPLEHVWVLLLIVRRCRVRYPWNTYGCVVDCSSLLREVPLEHVWVCYWLFVAVS